jgi:hypothetical protein
MRNLILFIVFVFSIQVSAQQLTQTITGKVSDQITQEGLIGANIKLQNIEPLMGATSDYESRPFIEQEPMSYYLDMTLTLRKNKPTYSTIWALQVKNMLGSPNYEFVYNYQTNEIEENAIPVVIPNLSWKIEF